MAQAPAAMGIGPREIAPLRFGTIVFLASELVFFGGLFAAYFTLRSETTPWPPAGVELDMVRPSVAPALLVLSSCPLVFRPPVATPLLLPSRSPFGAGRRGPRAGRPAPLSRWIVVTVLLALAFLG